MYYAQCMLDYLLLYSILICVLNMECVRTSLKRIKKYLINIYYNFMQVSYHYCPGIEIYGTFLQK